MDIILDPFAEKKAPPAASAEAPAAEAQPEDTAQEADEPAPAQEAPAEAQPDAAPAEEEPAAPEKSEHKTHEKKRSEKNAYTYPYRKRKRHRARIIVPVLILAVLLSLFIVVTHSWNDEIVTYDTSNPYITPYGQTMVSAHRSGGGIFPENTLMAFEGCVTSKDFKTDIFEFDLHITKDGKLILLHDDTLDRTTDSEEVFGVTGARPEDYTLAELKTLNFGDGFIDDNGNAPYRGLRGSAVPASLHAATLEEVLELLEKSGDYRYIIEIKNRKELGYDAADALYGILKSKKLLDKAVVGTFNAEVTRYIDEQFPDMYRSASIAEVLEFYVSALLDLKCAPGYYKYKALQIPANQFVIKLGTSRITNYAHKNNIAVQYWTINAPEDMQYLKDINADCVMSDVPDTAYGVLNAK